MTQNMTLLKKLDDNIELFMQILISHEDIDYRIIENIYNKRIRICLISVAGMIDKDLINENIIKPIILANIEGVEYSKRHYDKMINSLILTNRIERASQADELVTSLLYGDTILLLDGLDEAVLVSSRNLPARALDELPSERAIKGPREGFIELLSENISLIRKRIKSSNLIFSLKKWEA